MLLMLYGINLVDLVEREVPVAEHKTPIAYTVMPTVYTKGCDWPKTSNLKCWECHEVPVGAPAFIPTNYCRREERSGVYGHFCRWICAASRVHREWPEHKRADQLGALRIVMSHFTGRYDMFIGTIIPITELQEYKGASGMTRATWYQSNSTRQSESGSVMRMEDFDVGARGR